MAKVKHVNGSKCHNDIRGKFILSCFAYQKGLDGAQECHTLHGYLNPDQVRCGWNLPYCSSVSMPPI